MQGGPSYNPYKWSYGPLLLTDRGPTLYIWVLLEKQLTSKYQTLTKKRHRMSLWRFIFGQMKEHFSNLDFPEIAGDFGFNLLRFGGIWSHEVVVQLATFWGDLVAWGRRYNLTRFKRSWCYSKIYNWWWWWDVQKNDLRNDDHRHIITFPAQIHSFPPKKRKQKHVQTLRCWSSPFLTKKSNCLKQKFNNFLISSPRKKETNKKN